MRTLRLAFSSALAIALLAAAILPSHAQQPSGQPAARQRAAAQPKAETRPAWNELSATQQQALKPLAGQWTTMSEAQKRKWIEISRNYGRLPPEGQAKLHSRMSEWVALSPQQRTQARLNFGETKNLSADDKRAKWEAYQALSPEEKKKLAARAPRKTPPTAAAVRPIPAQKLARVPSGNQEAKPPRIAAGPHAQQPVPPAAQPN
jgi:hypothetical protein